VNEEEFIRFLKRQGRTADVALRVAAIVGEFARHLEAERGKGLDEAAPADLEAYVASIECAPKTSAKGQLWAICYYYDYSGNQPMRERAHALRAARVAKAAFPLAGFQGVDPTHVARLAAVGVKDAAQMLAAAATPAARVRLAERAGVPPVAVEELTRLADLARLPGVKGVRARLYYDAGVDSVERLAAWEPEALRAMLVEYVARTGFDGIAPLPKEAEHTVATARRLPRVVEY